jgi:4-hydroxybenzoate polyprenyltransferase
MMYMRGLTRRAVATIVRSFRCLRYRAVGRSVCNGHSPEAFRPAFIQSSHTGVDTVIRLTKLQVYSCEAIFIPGVGLCMSGNRSVAHLLIASLANLTMLVFGFVYNDIEDWRDDGLEPRKKRRNLLAAGMLDRRKGMAVALVAAATSLVLSATLGSRPTAITLAALLIMFFYSWPRSRLKAHAVLDMVSHGTVPALACVAAYMIATPAGMPGPLVCLAGLFFSLESILALLKHQVYDIQTDQEAGLRTTAVVLGPGRTRLLILAVQIVLVTLLALLVILGAVPMILVAIYVFTLALILAGPICGRLAGVQGDVGRWRWLAMRLAALVTLVAWYSI